MNIANNNLMNKKQVFENIKTTVENSTKKYLNLQLSVQNMNAIINDIVNNLGKNVPDFKTYIESITYSIDPVKRNGHIQVSYNQLTTQKFGVKELKITIS